jgi:hypothetical protein
MVIQLDRFATCPATAYPWQPLPLRETIGRMKRVLLRFTDGRETILEIDIENETSEIKYGWPAQTFLATEEIKNGLDVYEEEQTVDV